MSIPGVPNFATLTAGDEPLSLFDTAFDAVKSYVDTQVATAGGTVTHTLSALTLGVLLVGNGAGDLKPMASAGTAHGLLHGNPSDEPTWGLVDLANEVTGLLPVTAIDASGYVGDGSKVLHDNGVWGVPGGGGTVTHTAGGLTSSAVLVGNGADDAKVLASLGTVHQVLHGNAAGLPTWGAIDLANDVSGLLPVSALGPGTGYVGSGSKVLSDAGTWITVTGVGTVTSITFSGPLTGGTISGTGTVGIPNASGSVTGALTSTDWTTFNGKAAAIGNVANEFAVAPAVLTTSAVPLAQGDARYARVAGSGAQAFSSSTMTSATVNWSTQLASGDYLWINATGLHAGWPTVGPTWFAATSMIGTGSGTGGTTIGSGTAGTGKLAAVFGVRGSQASNGALYSSVISVANNDLPSGSGNCVLYSLYTESYKQANVAALSAVQAYEAALINRYSVTAQCDPYRPSGDGTNGITEGFRVTSFQLGSQTQYPCSVAYSVIGSASSGQGFLRGLNIDADAIITGGSAISMATGHTIQWFGGVNTPTSGIRCDGTTSAGGMKLVFGDYDVAIQNAAGTAQFQVAPGADPNNPIFLIVGGVQKQVTIDGSGFLKGV